MNLLFVGLEDTEPQGRNLSKTLVDSVASLDLGSHRVEGLVLPASWDRCLQPLESVLQKSWDAIVLFADKDCGAVAVERVAINETSASEKDIDGRRPRDRKIDPSGEPGYWSFLPHRELSSRLSELRFQAMSSHSAGMGLANFVFYRLMQALSEFSIEIPAGLIQLPRTLEPFPKETARVFVSGIIDVIDPESMGEDSLSVDVSKFRQFGASSGKLSR